MKRITRAWKLFCRRQRHPLDDRYLTPEARVVVSRKQVKFHRREARIYRTAFVLALIAALTFWYIGGKQAEQIQKQVELRTQLQERQQATLDQFGGFINTVNDALVAVPVSINALEANRLREAATAGAFEAQRNHAQKNLQQCWSKYEALNKRLDILSTRVDSYRGGARDGPKSWASDVNTGE